MYDELIKSLRVCASSGLYDSCLKCPRFENGCDTLREDAADAIEVLSKMEKATQWIPMTDKEHIPNTDHGVVGYFGGGAFNQLRWYDFVTTLSDGKIVGESTERDVINEHCIAVYKLPEPPKEET